MTPPNDSKQSGVEAAVFDQDLREKQRKDTSGFLWGTWIMLFLTLVLGHDTVQGFLSGGWVDISSDDSGLWVPWWLAAALTVVLLLFALWCFGEYVTLKSTTPKTGSEARGSEDV